MTIPADIQKTAAALYNRLGCGSVADEQAIAKALMARDERCAVIAQNLEWQPAKPSPNNPTIKRITADWGRKIAAAIRTPSTGA